MSAAYPVGSIYINAGSSSNPNVLLGFGTWTAFGAGRVLVGLNSSDTLFDTLEETGGSKDAIAVTHSHTATSTVTDSGHAHDITDGEVNTRTNPYFNWTGTGGASVGTTGAGTNSATTGITVATTIADGGSSGTNANVQPFIVVNMWKRTA